MNDRQARDFIHQISKYGSVYGLDGIRGLMERLGNVQEQLSIIHVAGTNGKGSVCAMISSVLRAAGYRVGVYSSPAVFDAEEIITVDGKMISSEEFAGIATKVQAACEKMRTEGLTHPTAFEVETAIAFCYFHRMGCDFVVLETGLGGALDATNLISCPICSVLTSISMDHMAVLGDTLAEIAKAKAGIMKSGCPCVSAVQKPEAAAVIEKMANSLGCKLYVADPDLIDEFEYDRSGSHFRLAEAESGKLSSKVLHCTLAGEFQKQNLACALTVRKVLLENGVQISMKAVSAGLANVQLHGRFEHIHEHPDFYIDGAHNVDAVSLLRATIQKSLTNRIIVYIIGVLADKDYEKALKPILPYAVQIYTVTPHNVRALDGGRLAEWVKRYHPAAAYVPDLAQAVTLAMDAAGAGGVVLAFGSLSFLGEIRQAVKDNIWKGI